MENRFIRADDVEQELNVSKPYALYADFLDARRDQIQNAAYSGTDFKPSFSPKFFRESRME